jgi:hypothetical protein
MKFKLNVAFKIPERRKYEKAINDFVGLVHLDPHGRSSLCSISI